MEHEITIKMSNPVCGTCHCDLEISIGMEGTRISCPECSKSKHSEGSILITEV